MTEVRTQAEHDALTMRLFNILVLREARRMELLEFVQEQVGTAWTCTNCGHSSYHAFNKECADCGTDFPLENLIAFKLHADIPNDDEHIEAAIDHLAGFVAMEFGIDVATDLVERTKVASSQPAKTEQTIKPNPQGGGSTP